MVIIYFDIRSPHNIVVVMYIGQNRRFAPAAKSEMERWVSKVGWKLPHFDFPHSVSVY